MAHYAFLNEDYVVTEVIVGKDERLFDWENYYTIKKGQICKRTSYNTKGGIYYNPITKEVSFNSEKSSILYRNRWWRFYHFHFGSGQHPQHHILPQQEVTQPSPFI
jgi:hypothetical protein